MTERILKGPFLTRAQAARRARVPARLVLHRPDLLRVAGTWLQEAYFGFQFDRSGVRPDLGTVVQELKREYSDIEIADWLVRPNQVLGYSSPLKFLAAGGVERVLAAAAGNGPISDTADEAWPEVEHEPTVLHDPGRSPARRPRRRRTTHRPAFGSR